MPRTRAFARLALLLPVALAPAWAAAATFTVTKTSDTFDGACNSDCSLREAVAAANANPGTDTIALGGSVYSLTRITPQDPALDDNVVFDEEDAATGDLDLRDSVVIRGKRGLTAIDGTQKMRIFEVHPGVTAAIRDLEIRNGHERVRGAGLENAGTATLSWVRFRFNYASSGFNLGQGGAISNTGTLTVNDGQFRVNQAGGGEASAGEGGAIWNSGTLTVRRSLFSGNHTHDDNDLGGGGAILSRGGKVLVDRCFFQSNSTGQNGHGGALAVRDGGALRVVNSTISGNDSGEPGVGGGAIANGTHSGEGGTLFLNYVTVADNDGGGVFSNGPFTVYDSIIVGNYEDYGSEERQYAAGVNCNSLTFPIAAGNIVALDGQGCRAQTYVDNATAMATVLHPLANNGGFAPTHALREFEPAFDAASQGAGACPATDQRGTARPQDGNDDGVPGCDVGAFERGDDD